MHEAARLAEEGDLPLLSELVLEHRSQILDHRGGPELINYEIARFETQNVTLLDRLDNALKSDEHLLVVGTYDKVAFGVALISFEQPTETDKLAVLQIFLVDKAIRSSGIGEAMMDFIVESAQSRGCTGLDSIALPGDRSTKNFFESFGMKARKISVHKRI